MIDSLNPYRNFYVGVDFDDTCIIRGEKFPEIKEDMPLAVASLKAFDAAGMKILLITSREGDELKAAEAWFAQHGIPLAGVNKNPDVFWHGHRKIFCDVGIDDRHAGHPTLYDPDRSGRVTNWRLCAVDVFHRYVNFLMERIKE